MIRGASLRPYQERAAEKIIALAGRPGGFKNSELADHDMKTTSAISSRLCDQGRLFRVKISHKNVIFYASAQAAQDRMKAERRDKPAGVTIGPLKGGPRFSPDAVVDYSRAIYTYAPPPPASTRTNTHSIT